MSNSVFFTIRAWSQSASYVMNGASVKGGSGSDDDDSVCQHSVFNGADRRHIYKNPEELAVYLKNVVRRFRKSKMAK